MASTTASLPLAPAAATPARASPWRSRGVGLLLAWPFPLAVLLLWQLGAQFEWIPPQILPAPLVVAQTFSDLWATGELQDHLLISLGRVLYGFSLGAGLGLLLGVSMGLSPVVKDYLYPTFRLFAQVPSLGWLPLLMMLVGIDEALKIILIAKAAFVPVTMNTYNGLRNVPTSLIEVSKVSASRAGNCCATSCSPRPSRRCGPASATASRTRGSPSSPSSCSRPAKGSAS